MKVFAVAAVLALSVSNAHAGGITGGGGGVTNPDPISPESIVRLVQNESKPVLMSFLNSQEEKFQLLPPNEKAASPYRKLFEGKATIFDVMETAGVDLEIHQPCFDSERAPKDGSVYSRTPGYVCLSPFSMAPKLNEATYVAETMALVLHELTHKLGTTEDEATAIQKDAVKIFRTLDLEEFAKRIHGAESSGRYHGSVFNQFVQTPEAFQAQTAAPALERLGNYLGELSFSSTSRYSSRLSMLRTSHYAFILTTMYRAMIATDYRTLQNSTTPESIRKLAQQRMDKGFGGQNEVSAYDYMTRALGNQGDFSQVFHDVKLQRIQNEYEIPVQLSVVRDTMKDVASQIKSLEQTRFRTN